MEVYCQHFVIDTINVFESNHPINTFLYANEYTNQFDDSIYYNIRLSTFTKKLTPYYMLKPSRYYAKMGIRDFKKITELIEELLQYEGDVRKCILPAKNRWSERENCVLPDSMRIIKVDSIYNRYSLETQALYLIYQIANLDNFRFSNFPILCETNLKPSGFIECATVEDRRITREAFKSIKIWFEQVKEQESISLVNPPFSFTKRTIFWYNNCYQLK